MAIPIAFGIIAGLASGTLAHMRGMPLAQCAMLALAVFGVTGGIASQR